MAKHFRLRRDGRCEQVMKRGQHADYPIGHVCKVEGGWTYGYVGGPKGMRASTKTAAIKKVIRSHATYVGKRSVFEGASRRRRRRR